MNAADLVMAYEVPCKDGKNRRIALWLTKDKEVLVTNTITEKSLVCFGMEHGLYVFESCISVFKEKSEASA